MYKTPQESYQFELKLLSFSTAKDEESPAPNYLTVLYIDVDYIFMVDLVMLL